MHCIDLTPMFFCYSKAFFRKKKKIKIKIKIGDILYHYDRFSVKLQKKIVQSIDFSYQISFWEAEVVQQMTN